MVKFARLTLFLIFFLIFLLPYFLRVKEVSCFVSNKDCPSEVTSQLEKLKGVSYFKARGEIDKLLKGNSLVFSYNSRFIFPSRLIFNIILRKSSYVLKNTKSNSFYLISEKGEVLARRDNLSDISSLETDAYDFKVGDKVPEDVLVSMSLFYYLNYLYKINYAKLFDDRLEVKILAGPILVLPTEGKDREYLVGASRFLLSQLEENYDKFRLDKSYDNITIDLRYKNPVLR
jgi:hypothetical protein